MDITTNTVGSTVIDTDDGSNSAVSLAAILAGALTMAAVALILLILGSGLGFSVVSPWAYEGVSASTFAISAVIWLIVVQWISAAFGGYLTGRLRTRWLNVHEDEVYFRDTAHGFLAWALATLVSAVILASAITSVVSGSLGAVTAVTAGAAAGAGQAAIEKSPDPSNSISNYVLDGLFRSAPATPVSDVPSAPAVAAQPEQSEMTDPAVTETTPQDIIPSPGLIRPAPAQPAPRSLPLEDARAQAMVILANGVTTGTYPEEDKAYLAQLVAAQTGASMQESTQRVNKTISTIETRKTEVRQTADTARKAAAKAALFSFLSLLIGAFIASAAAALGGHHRDD